MQIKDPLVWRPEDWNFPAGADWSIAALGRVHRGTPWQTIYLKASDVTTNNAIATGITGLDAWAQWTGDPDLNDAQLTAPITDWQLLGVLIPLLNTNNPAQLVSVNDGNLADWQNALDGLLVVSNSSPDFQGYLSSPPFDTYVMAGGSAHAGYIANAIAQARAGQPGQRFATLGSILQTAALSENSPWLNWNDTLQYQYAITDAAYEAIPAQLLPRLRPDSIGAVVSTNGAWQVQFSGSDAWIYTLQTSPDLINWTTVSTNVPVQGSFNATIAPGPAAPKQFFRSVLLP